MPLGETRNAIGELTRMLADQLTAVLGEEAADDPAGAPSDDVDRRSVAVGDAFGSGAVTVAAGTSMPL
mgnify:CR=1 FL=1